MPGSPCSLKKTHLMSRNKQRVYLYCIGRHKVPPELFSIQLTLDDDFLILSYASIVNYVRIVSSYCYSTHNEM